MKELRKYLKMARGRVTKAAAALPNQDAYATAYSILVDLAADIDTFFKDIEPAMKEAKTSAKNNQQQLNNRAKKWCVKP